MKHEVTTLNTKRTITGSLKKCLHKKPLSKITVSEIINDCGLNRKTFYYHFEDIYALLKWMLEQEAINVVKKFDLVVDYEKAMIFIMNYIEENEEILLNIYNSLGRDELKGFFYIEFIDIVSSIVDKAEIESQIQLPDDFKNFLCQFYSEAIAGVIVHWLNDPSIRDREKTIAYISTIFFASIPNILLSTTESITF